MSSVKGISGKEASKTLTDDELDAIDNMIEAVKNHLHVIHLNSGMSLMGFTTALGFDGDLIDTKDHMELVMAAVEMINVEAAMVVAVDSSKGQIHVLPSHDFLMDGEMTIQRANIGYVAVPNADLRDAYLKRLFNLESDVEELPDGKLH